MLTAGSIPELHCVDDMSLGKTLCAYFRLRPSGLPIAVASLTKLLVTSEPPRKCFLAGVRQTQIAWFLRINEKGLLRPAVFELGGITCNQNQ